MLIEGNMACFNQKQARVIHQEYFESFNSLPKVLGMLTFGAINVIHRRNYLSESQIGQSY